jgi:hypothetical protein
MKIEPQGRVRADEYGAADEGHECEQGESCSGADEHLAGAARR